MSPARGRAKGPAPTFFATAAAFRAWLEAHHATAAELVVGFWKKGSGRPSLTWPESVDEALCFGWIDGVRKRIDDDAYQIRFTPRRAKSIWSAINLANYERLCAAGRMTEAGRAAYERRSEDRSAVYAYEQRHQATLAPAELRQLQSNKKAWKHFESCPPSYRQVILYWITSAKRPETRAARLEKLIEASAGGKRLD